MWSEDTEGALEALAGDASEVAAAAPPAAMYFVVLAARSAASLPAPDLRASFFSDRDDTELARIDARSAEVLRLDALLGERDAALDRQSAHVRHLEEIAAYRERLVVERDAQLGAAMAERSALLAGRDENDRARATAVSELASARQALGAIEAERERLERALAAQERIIAYRQSVRWWLAMPWLRAKLWWQRVRPS